MVSFSPQLAHFLKDVKHAISTRRLANSNRDHSHFPHSFWRVVYEYLIRSQNEDSCAHELVT